MEILKTINNAVWGTPTLILMIGTGVFFSLKLKFFQIVRFPVWIKETLLSIFRAESHKVERRRISQFQALSTALAATVGTGSIAGVASAIVMGGPGAVFWMILSSVFGMMTKYAEIALSIYYRKIGPDGGVKGGAMYYIRYGLGRMGLKKTGEILSCLFALFCMLASFGIGNMSQCNTIAVNVSETTGLSRIATGILLTLIVGIVIFGGVKRIASVTEKLVPFMSVMYIIGTLAVIIAGRHNITRVFGAIIADAFDISAIKGGAFGIGTAGLVRAASWGLRRGVFSNEAGMGSSATVHAAADVTEPAKQGMWGIFEVFTDTVVVCLLTALALLCSNVVDIETGAKLVQTEDMALAAAAFSTVFGAFGKYFITVSVFCFALSTVLGWSYYGAEACKYLFGGRGEPVYKALYTASVFIGSVTDASVVWAVSDIFNGLMAFPNLTALLLLSGTVTGITLNYEKRIFKKKKISPIVTAWK